jgi:hypothetical protein
MGKQQAVRRTFWNNGRMVLATPQSQPLIMTPGRVLK